MGPIISGMIGEEAIVKHYQVPGLVELDLESGEARLDRAALPRAAKRIFFGRGLSGRVIPKAIYDLAGSRAIVVVAGSSGARTSGISELLNQLRRARASGDPGIAGGAGPDHTRISRSVSPDHAKISDSATPDYFGRCVDALHIEILHVAGHADHAAILAGIHMVRCNNAGLVVVIGGGTVLDVGKSVAALARQENGEDVAAFQLGKRQVAPENALPWIAVPTTSGTGSESSDNAVIELGEEKRSIRGIPPASLIVSDPALTDSLPLKATIISAIDALAQSLEIFTNAGANESIQKVALSAFAALAEGIEGLYETIEGIPSTCTIDKTSDSADARMNRSDGKANIMGDQKSGTVDAATRDLLSWGSLLMGISFAHARLGLPHALVHFCSRFGLLHGNMVGIMLAPGLAVQARDPETSRRLARAARVIHDLLAQCKPGETPGINHDDSSLPHAPELAMLTNWLRERIIRLFNAVGLPCSLRAAGLTQSDINWIAERELANHPSLGIPARPASLEELKEASNMALDLA